MISCISIGALASVIILFSFAYLYAEEWVIIANAPSIPAKTMKRITSNRSVVALDGAADLLKEIQLIPDVILGDFDSIVNKDFWEIKENFNTSETYIEPYIGRFGVLIVPIMEQNHTDLEKGITYCDRQGASSIIIMNATEGRIDHTLGNIGVLRKYHQSNRKLVIITEKEFIEFVKDDHTTIEGKKGDHCAIMGYPEAVMTTTGLAYNGSGYPLKLGYQESTCNTLAEEKAYISIQGEALVIHPNKITAW